MLEAFTIKEDKVVKLKPDQIRRSFTWIRCLKPTINDLELLAKISKIPQHEFMETIEEEERPKITTKRHLEIIYRTPFIENGDIVTLPVYFYLYKNLIITIEQRPDITLTEISDLMHKHKRKFLLKKDAGYFIFHVLDKINDRFLAHIDKIGESIEIFEQNREFSEATIEKIYDSSVALSYFNQALLANIEVLNHLRKSYYKQFNDEHREHFAELYFDGMQILDTERIHRDIITNLFNLQSIISSNRLNIYMKRLASLALLVMIPTFITGAYGMNFAYLPLKNHPYGFFILLGIMTFISVFFALLFIKADWL